MSRIRLESDARGKIADRSPLLCVLVAMLSVSGCRQAPSAPVTLSVVGLGLEAAEQLRYDAVDEFTRSTGIQVDLIPTLGTSGEQLSQALKLLSQHSVTPDVYVLDVIWPGTLSAGLLDLKPYAAAQAKEHLPQLVQNDTIEGRLVSLPFYVNVGMLYYRTDLLKKYGYSHPPATWDELETMSWRIQRGERAEGNGDFWGFVWQGGDYEGLTCNALEWQASFGGGHVIESDRTITVNNARALQAFRQAAHWVGRISPRSVLSYTEADALAVFRSGNAAFMRHWSGGLNPSRAIGSAVQDRFAATLLPAGSRGRAQAMGGFHVAVSRYSTHPQESARLALFLTSGPVQMRRGLSSGYLPTIPSLYRRPELQRGLFTLAALRDAPSDTWVIRPSTVCGSQYRAVSSAYSKAVHEILSQSAGEDALSELQNGLVTLTGFRVGAPRD